MPLFKRRSVEDLPPAPELAQGDPNNLRVAIELSRTCYRLRPWRLKPGLHKYRSAEEAHRQQQAWAAAGEWTPG